MLDYVFHHLIQIIKHNRKREPIRATFLILEGTSLLYPSVTTTKKLCLISSPVVPLEKWLEELDGVFIFITGWKSGSTQKTKSENGKYSMMYAGINCFQNKVHLRGPSDSS